MTCNEIYILKKKLKKIYKEIQQKKLFTTLPALRGFIFQTFH